MLKGKAVPVLTLIVCVIVVVGAQMMMNSESNSESAKAVSSQAKTAKLDQLHRLGFEMALRHKTLKLDQLESLLGRPQQDSNTHDWSWQIDDTRITAGYMSNADHELISLSVRGSYGIGAGESWYEDGTHTRYTRQ